MGKKQHQQDKLYLTTTEWKNIYGGHKDTTETRLTRAKFKRLPFTHCALSMLPFEDPVCTQEGVIFDLTHIIPYLKKYGINPVTGKKLDPKSLIHLKFGKDDKGGFRCPVTFRQFTPNSHIVTIRQTGNVYSMEAVQELNLKRNHLKDLLNDEPFQRKDIIPLQDPGDLDKFNLEKFYHIQYDLKTKAEIAAEKKAMEDPKFFLRRMNNETRETLAQLDRDYKAPEKSADEDLTADEINAAHYSQGKVAAGFTSTVMEPITRQKAAVLDADVVKYSRVKKNGYVRMVTNFGSLNLELFCEQTPKACENFLQHCKTGYYDNTKFHRLIRNFMIQGGDPTGTGQGGESIWGKPFKDEFVKAYSHTTRGILSMANKGTDTNQSQFFITFRPCKHLDGKHTIFGRVVGGMDVLTEIERVETDKKTDKPLKDVIFMASQVFVDPFEEAEASIKKEREAIKNKTAQAAKSDAAKSDASADKPKAFKTGVGKYIRPDVLGKKREKDDQQPSSSAASDASQSKKKKALKTDLSDFSVW
uniref:RING-type E3 ubiquitin-protein ligase PPIL2 n=2 Tax=Plectus sambesii TaxID=2011161 RepID=A0A914UY15_9BILA